MVERFQREKHICAINEFKSMMDFIIRDVQEHHKSVIVMVKEHNNLRAHTKDVSLKALERINEGKILKGSLDETLSSLKDLEEKASSLKEEGVAAFDQYFDRAMEQVSFF